MWFRCADTLICPTLVPYSRPFGLMAVVSGHCSHRWISHACPFLALLGYHLEEVCPYRFSPFLNFDTNSIPNLFAKVNTFFLVPQNNFRGDAHHLTYPCAVVDHPRTSGSARLSSDITSSSTPSPTPHRIPLCTHRQPPSATVLHLTHTLAHSPVSHPDPCSPHSCHMTSYCNSSVAELTWRTNSNSSVRSGKPFG